MAISITNIGAQITIAVDGVNHNYPVNSLTAEVVFNSNNTAIQIKHFGNIVHVFENVANRVATPPNTGAADLVSQLSFFFDSPPSAGGISAAENGLTANLTTVKLGGTLVEDTAVDGAGLYSLALQNLISFTAQFQGANGNGFLGGNETQLLALFVDILSALGGDIKIDGLTTTIRHDIALLLNAPQVFLPLFAAGKVLKTIAGGEIVGVADTLIQTQRLTSTDITTSSATFANTSQFIVVEPAANFGKTTINAVLNVFARTNNVLATGEAVLSESRSSLGVFVDVVGSLVAIPASAIPATDPYEKRNSASFALPAAGGVYQLRIRRVTGIGGQVPQFRASEIQIIYS